LELFFVRVVTTTAPAVTTTIAAAIEISAALLNSGTVGVGAADVDEVGLAEAEVLAESDRYETVLEPLSAMNSSPTLES